MTNVNITDFIVKAWLKSLCKMDERYYDYLDAWDEMSSSEKKKFNKIYARM